MSLEAVRTFDDNVGFILAAQLACCVHTELTPSLYLLALVFSLSLVFFLLLLRPVVLTLPSGSYRDAMLILCLSNLNIRRKDEREREEEPHCFFISLHGLARRLEQLEKDTQIGGKTACRQTSSQRPPPHHFFLFIPSFLSFKADA